MTSRNDIKLKCPKLEAKYLHEAKQLGLSDPSCQKYVKIRKRDNEYVLAECSDAFKKFYMQLKKSISF